MCETTVGSVATRLANASPLQDCATLVWFDLVLSVCASVGVDLFCACLGRTKGGNTMTRQLLISLVTCGWLLVGARSGWAQGYDLGVAGTVGNLGNLSNFGLNPGTLGRGETMPGA